MTKTLIVLAIIALIVYYYYQKQKPKPVQKDNWLIWDREEIQIQSNSDHQLKLDKEFLETEKAEIQAKLTNKENELNSILNKWNWGSWKPKNATEFLNKFEPWIEKHLDQEKTLKEFEKEHGSLTEASSKLAQQEKDKKHLESEVKKLKEAREESEEITDLEIERDEAIRKKTTLEQENTSLSNRLKLKQDEVNAKEKELDRLKTQAQEKDKALNDKISEWKKKYQAKVKQFDEEQLENKRINEEIEKLNLKIQELETERTKLLKNQKDHD